MSDDDNLTENGLEKGPDWANIYTRPDGSVDVARQLRALLDLPTTAEREEMLRRVLCGVWCEGVDDAIEDIPGGEEYASSIGAHVDRIPNPYAGGQR